MGIRILDELHELLDVMWIKTYCIVLHCIVLYIHHINVALDCLSSQLNSLLYANGCIFPRIGCVL